MTTGTAPRARGRRPLTVLVAAVLALGGIGTAAGLTLGAVGAASADAPGVGRHHQHDRDLRFGPR